MKSDVNYEGRRLRLEVDFRSIDRYRFERHNVTQCHRLHNSLKFKVQSQNRFKFNEQFH